MLFILLLEHQCSIGTLRIDCKHVNNKKQMSACWLQIGKAVVGGCDGEIGLGYMTMSEPVLVYYFIWTKSSANNIFLSCCTPWLCNCLLPWGFFAEFVFYRKSRVYTFGSHVNLMVLVLVDLHCNLTLAPMPARLHLQLARDSSHFTLCR